MAAQSGLSCHKGNGGSNVGAAVRAMAGPMSGNLMAAQSGLSCHKSNGGSNVGAAIRAMAGPSI